MLLRNVLHSTALLIKRRRPYLPSLRKLGSRLLNAIVILSFILPNATIAVQAALPEDEAVYIPRVMYVSQKTAENTELLEAGSSYQAPVFIHPEPRKAEDMPVLRSLQSSPPAAPLLDPVEVSWDGDGGDNNWETAANWSNDLVPDANSNVTIDANVTVQLNGTTTINGLVMGDSASTYSPTLNFNYDAITNGALILDEGDLTIYSGSYITHSNGITDTSIFSVNIDVLQGNADLFGTINVSNKGYPGGQEEQDGYGPGKGLKAAPYGDAASGAGHGGRGGNSQTELAGGGTYDVLDSTTLLTPGSGGGGGSPGWASFSIGGNGGGLVKISSGGYLNLVGIIAVNGENGDDAGTCCGARGAGGGAGGSIYLSADSITGSGSLAATGGQGGDAEKDGGGGGGGRVYVYFNTSNTYSGAINTTGGDAPIYAQDGQDGTNFIENSVTHDLIIPAGNGIWYANEKNSWSFGDLDFQDNINIASTSAVPLVITSSGTSTISDNTTITLIGSYTSDTIGAGLTLDLSGDVTIPATSTISANGTGFDRWYLT